MRVNTRVALLAAGAVLAGCGSSEPREVPDVRGERLDVAEERLDRLGLEYEEVGGGAFGIVVKSNWRVCDQDPAAGASATKVRLIVDRSCPPPEPRRVILPDLVGRTLEQAEDELEDLKVPYRLESWAGGELVRAGARVCDQEPDAGRRAAQVTVYVAPDCSAPELEPEVPAVVGLDVAQAVEVLDSLGIVAQIVSSQGDVEPWFDVCSQSPEAGARAGVVTLDVRPDC